jgi:hypothetical protein
LVSEERRCAVYRSSVTKALDAEMNLALGYSTSGAKELQKKLPSSHVVKAFNTVFAQHLDSGRLGDQPLTAFVASDYAEAQSTVLDLARGIGFDAVDGGPLRSTCAGNHCSGTSHCDIPRSFIMMDAMRPDLGTQAKHSSRNLRDCT